MSDKNCKNCYWINRLENAQSGFIGICGNVHSTGTINVLKTRTDWCINYSINDERSIHNGDSSEPKGRSDIFLEKD